MSKLRKILMYKYYDYMCDDFHRTTEFQDNKEVKKEIQCPECGKVAIKAISAPHISAAMGTDPNSAQGNRWAKMHRDEAKRQNKAVGNTPES